MPPYNGKGAAAKLTQAAEPRSSATATDLPELTRKRKKGQRLTTEEIRKEVTAMIEDARSYTTERGLWRAKASDYYMGMPFGDEMVGRSQAVITVVRDTIHGILPSLMRVFFGGEPYVEYAPRRMAQVPWAEQATEFVGQITLQTDNPGFEHYLAWFKDALLKREGIVKWYHEDLSTMLLMSGQSYSAEELAILRGDDDVKITDVQPAELTTPVDGEPMFDVRYTKTQRRGKNKFTPIPPDEWLITRGARSIDDATMVGHLCEKSRSDLLAMGVDEKILAAYGTRDAALESNLEEITRQRGTTRSHVEDVLDDANQKISYGEIYPYLDVDGDGQAELVKICVVGPTYYPAEDPIPVDERPFAWLCPDPEPHTVDGLGMADYTMDVQKIMSMIVRALHDSLAQAITNRTVYVEGLVSAADIRNVEIGAPIRVKDVNAVKPLEHSFLGASALPVLQYWDEVLKKRTGLVDGSNGLPADALQSTTQAAVAAVVQQAQAQIEMIARVFAETGVRRLMTGLLKLTIQYPDPERVFRMRGAYVAADPRKWDSDLDVKVNVALGSGSAEQQVGILTDTADRQKEILLQFGPNNPMCGLNDYRATLVRRLKKMGQGQFADMAFHEVPQGWMPPPQPDPNMALVQVEQQKAQAQAQIAQQKAALEGERARVDELRRAVDLKLAHVKMILEDERERDRLELDAALRIEQMQLQFNAGKAAGDIQAQTQQIIAQNRQTSESAIRREEALLEHLSSVHESNMSAAATMGTAPETTPAAPEAADTSSGGELA